MLRHIAIIMDGNGRWAQARGLPRAEGHRAGVEAVRRVVTAAGDLGVAHLTLYSFSSENWARPRAEIVELFGLIRRFIRTDLARLHEAGVRITVIGSREGIGREICRLIEEAEKLTRANTRMHLQIAFNYGARAEITEAARRLAQRCISGELHPRDISEEALDAALQTSGVPDPDLLIRTSGEQRISNFLLWQCAYTEFVFTPVLWPDFSADDLNRAVAEFQGRERRFGGVDADKRLKA
ncbi:MAG: isoprenyl transferase [Flavobacteriaceae bacterium]